MKRILFLLTFICVGFCFFSYASNEGAFSQYKQEIIENGGFPVEPGDEVQRIIQKAPYDSIYLYVDPEEFSWLVNPDKRNKIDTISVTGVIIQKKTNYEQGVLSQLQDYLVPDVQVFNGNMTLRGGLSLHCGKPSFKIKNDTADFDLKLKGFCGASYGIEEKLFGGLIEHLSSPLLHPYHVFFVQQHYYKVYVNGHMYGIYLDVPVFNKQFLEDNGIINPKKKDNCIVKAGRFVIPTKETPWLPLTSRLELNQQGLTDEQIDRVLEVKYGKDKTCYNQTRNLLETINRKDVQRKEIERMIHPESVLLRGMVLWYTNNHISFTHNYLMVHHNGRFAAGFWDVENFQGCKKQGLNEYRSSDNRTTNVLFSHVLRWYQENDPERIKYFEKLIDKHICTFDKYHYFKNTDLQYVMADRYLWNMGNITPVDDLKNGTFVQDFVSSYERKLDFANFFKKQYELFDKYFGVNKTNVEKIMEDWE